MRIPPSLPAKGTIGFAAPSFGCATEPYHSAFLNGQKVLSSLGFTLKRGPNCLKDEGIGISSTPENCGQEINQMFADPSLNALISCGGGELMCEILDHVNFEAIRRRDPLWYMGFSDNTNLTFLLPTLCDTAAIYGPCAPVFGMEPWHKVVQDSLDLLMGKRNEIESYGKWELEGLKDEEHPLEPYNLTETTRLKVLLPGASGLSDGLSKPLALKGRLLGGCLDILNVLAGTCYDQVGAFAERYREDGVIWFLESCDLSVFDMRRALWHLEHCGWFKNVKGFVIGRPLHYGEEMMGLDQYLAVTAILEKYQVPVLMDADLGHLPPSMPMIVGAKTALTAKGHHMKFAYEL